MGFNSRKTCASATGSKAELARVQARDIYICVSPSLHFSSRDNSAVQPISPFLGEALCRRFQSLAPAVCAVITPVKHVRSATSFTAVVDVKGRIGSSTNLYANRNTGQYSSRQTMTSTVFTVRRQPSYRCSKLKLRSIATVKMIRRRSGSALTLTWKG